jgi:ribosome-associated protein
MTEEEKPSRSAMKRAAKAVEELARQMVDMPEAEWKKLPASPALRREIELARVTKGHGSRKRQTKHLAALLRQMEEETEELQAFLSGLDQVHLREQRDFHELEDLRDRICNPDLSEAALDEAASAMPGLDRGAISRLAGSVHAHGDRRAFREIFRRLREAKEKAAASEG